MKEREIGERDIRKEQTAVRVMVSQNKRLQKMNRVKYW